MTATRNPNKKPRINYALAATLLASGVTLAQAAERTGAGNARSLRVGLAKRGVTLGGIKSSEGNLDRIQGVALKAVSAASEALRHQFGDILAKHGEALSKVPAKRNLAHIRKVGEAFEPLARIGKIVHDWGQGGASGLVVIGGRPEPDAIEVEVAPAPESPACGVSPPTGGVLPENSGDQTPQA